MNNKAFFYIAAISLFLSQYLFAQETTTDEAHKRKLSKIKSCIVKKYGYTFGERNKSGQKIEENEYNKDGFELVSRSYTNELLTEYSSYQYDELNNVLSYSEFDKLNHLKSKRVNKFNDIGLQIESVEYDENGEIFIKQLFEYDNKLEIGGKTFYANGNLFSKWTYKYENKKIKEVTFYDSLGNVSHKRLFEYLKGKKNKMTVYKSNKSIDFEIIYEYPSKYKIIEKHSYNYFTEPTNYIITITNNKDGRIIEKLSVNKDGTRNWRIEYFYDKNGTLLEEKEFNSINEPWHSTAYEYTYY